jgi:hypothetical protein
MVVVVVVVVVVLVVVKLRLGWGVVAPRACARLRQLLLRR